MNVAASPYAPDRPHDLLDPDSDVFGHGDYADALVDALTKADTPFTVGVFGEWGVGKSTILAAVKNRLPSDCAFAFFDAWRYEGDALRRQFLRDVARQLEDANQLRGFDIENDLRDLDVEVGAMEEVGLSFSGAEAVRTLVMVIVGTALFYFMLRARATGHFFSGNGASTDAVGALLGSIVLSVVALAVRPLKVVQRTLTTRRIEEPDQFTARFEKLMGSVKAKRVIIAIDNLDRCSPEHAVEVLSTIKTYLEPSLERDQGRRFLGLFGRDKPPKEAVFLIAADSDALHRHLVGQESRRSEGTDVPAVERYVDEYLRKFFSATVPVRALLDEDVRTFVRSHLQPVVAAHARESEQELLLLQLVQMCAGGLRANPRRVKQFANNLELRLNLLAAREKPDHHGRRKIEPPISGELLMVAKLLMVEEEWPQRFTELQANPRLIQQWERRAREPSLLLEVGRGETDDAQDDERDEWDRFAAFLRLSTDVQTPNIRAFLFLKQSQDEVTLPGFQEFSELVVAGERAGVERFIGDDDQLAANCADRLPHILRSQVRERYFDGARAVLDIAVSIAKFAALPVAGQLIQEALQRPELRLELTKLDANAVLRLVRTHSPAAQVDAEALFAAEFEREMKNQNAAEGEGRLPELASALADTDGQLGEQARVSVANGVSANPARYTQVQALLRADPSFITEEIADLVVAGAVSSALPAGELPPLGDLDSDPEVWSLVELCLQEGRVTSERQDGLLTRFTQVLTPVMFSDS